MLFLLQLHRPNQTIKRQPKIESNGIDEKSNSNRTQWFRLRSEFRISNFVQYGRCSCRFNWRKHVPNEMHCYMCHIASFYHPISRNARSDRKQKIYGRVWFCPQETLAHMFPPHRQTDEKTNVPKNNLSSGACDAQTSRYEWPNNNVSNRFFLPHIFFVMFAMCLCAMCVCLSVYKCVKTH